MSNKSIKAPGDEAGPWFLLGEVRTVRCWRGEDELSARRGAGNVSSRPKDCEYTPTKCLSALNHWYTSTHINDGQLITSVWLRDAFYLFISAPQQHPAPSARLEMGWYGIFHVDEDRMDCCLCHRYGISISVALWWEPVGMVWNRKLSFFSLLLIFLQQNVGAVTVSLFISISVAWWLSDLYQCQLLVAAVDSLLGVVSILSVQAFLHETLT